MSKESKKHHYVPQSILRRFSIKNDLKSIYTYNKELEKSYSSSIKNTGSENKFNTIETEFGNFNLEFLYDKIDSIYASLSTKIIERGTIKELELSDFYNLALIISNQLLRTKLTRLTFSNINKQLFQMMDELTKEKNLINTYKELTKEEVKFLSIMNSVDLEKEIESLLKKGIYLIKNNTETPFIISDNPVILYNSFPYGTTSIDSEGIEIYFPLNTEYLIGFCCKSIIHKLRISSDLKILYGIGKMMLESIDLDNTLKINNSKLIEFYNQQQIINSHNFIYSSTNDFELIQETIQKIPNVKNNESRIKLGEMGKGPPPNKRLPLGDLLIVYGKKNHNLIPIELIKHTNSNIVFTAKENLLLQLILNDTPYKKIELYIDQSLRRLIREPEINLLNREKRYFEVTHTDKAVIKIIEEIIKKKNAR